MAKESVPLGYVPEPRASACLVNGFRVMWDDIVPLTVLGFVVAIAGAVSPLFLFGPAALKVGGMLFYVFIGFPLEVAFAFICLRAVRSGSAKLEHALAVTSHYREVVIAGIFSAMLIVGAAGFFVIPGVWVYCRLRFVPYLLLEDELEGGEAIMESFKMTRGLTPEIALICLAGGAAFALGGLALLLGIAPAIAWWHTSLASLYHATATAPSGWQIEDQEQLEAIRHAADEEAEQAGREA